MFIDGLRQSHRRISADRLNRRYHTELKAGVKRYTFFRGYRKRQRVHPGDGWRRQSMWRILYILATNSLAEFSKTVWTIRIVRTVKGGSRLVLNPIPKNDRTNTRKDVRLYTCGDTCSKYWIRCKSKWTFDIPETSSQ